MSASKIFTIIITVLNFYIGGRFFLNTIHVLNTSKYSKNATIVFAILFLSMGITSLYFTFIKSNNFIALLIAIGPWALALVMLLLNMLMGDYK